MNFRKAIPLILKHEGGFVNHPNDPGGATNKGITIATFRRYVKPDGTIEDLKALTEAQAVVVYKRQYWDQVLGDALPPGLNYAVADYAVNSGPSRAAKALQGILRVPQDGRIGPVTLKAISAHAPADLVDKLCDQRIAFMKGIRGGELWKTFGRGWSRRVAEVRSQGLAWAKSGKAAGSLAVPTAVGGSIVALIAAYGCQMPLAEYIFSACGG